MHLIDACPNPFVGGALWQREKGVELHDDWTRRPINLIKTKALPSHSCQGTAHQTGPFVGLLAGRVDCMQSGTQGLLAI